MSSDGGITWHESQTEYPSLMGTGEYGGINDNSFCTYPYNSGHFSDFNGLYVTQGLAYPMWTTNTKETPDAYDDKYTVVSPFYLWNCVGSYNLNSQTLSTDVTCKYECQNYIIAQNFVVPDNSFCFFDAGNEIVLDEDFHAEDGSLFHAYIDCCIGFDLNEEFYKYYSGNSSSCRNQLNNLFKENIYKKIIKIFPNPTNGECQVEIGDLAGPDSKFILTNFLSEPILNIKVTSGSSFTINLSNYPKGIYFAKLSANSHTYVNKIVYQ